MRTIGRNWPKSAPRGDYTATCDICGVPWRRSKLRREMDGRLVCPDEGNGRCSLELATLNAQQARSSRQVGGPRDGGVEGDDL